MKRPAWALEIVVVGPIPTRAEPIVELRVVKARTTVIASHEIDGYCCVRCVGRRRAFGPGPSIVNDWARERVGCRITGLAGI